MDILEQKWSLYVHPFELQRHLKNDTNTLKMDTAILEKPATGFVGTFRTVVR